MVGGRGSSAGAGANAGVGGCSAGVGGTVGVNGMKSLGRVMRPFESGSTVKWRSTCCTRHSHIVGSNCPLDHMVLNVSTKTQ